MRWEVRCEPCVDIISMSARRTPNYVSRRSGSTFFSSDFPFIWASTAFIRSLISLSLIFDKNSTKMKASPVQGIIEIKLHSTPFLNALRTSSCAAGGRLLIASVDERLADPAEERDSGVRPEASNTEGGREVK